MEQGNKGRASPQLFQGPHPTQSFMNSSTCVEREGLKAPQDSESRDSFSSCLLREHLS